MMKTGSGKVGQIIKTPDGEGVVRGVQNQDNVRVNLDRGVQWLGDLSDCVLIQDVGPTEGKINESSSPMIPHFDKIPGGIPDTIPQASSSTPPPPPVPQLGPQEGAGDGSKAGVEGADQGPKDGGGSQ